jgi:hypothetical protein
VTGGWTELHNEEFYNCYTSSNILRTSATPLNIQYNFKSRDTSIDQLSIVYIHYSPSGRPTMRLPYHLENQWKDSLTEYAVLATTGNLFRQILALQQWQIHHSATVYSCHFVFIFIATVRPEL